MAKPKLPQMPNLGAAGSYPIAKAHAAQFKMVLEWERRQYNWDAKYPDRPTRYDEMLDQYQRMVYGLVALELSPLRAAPESRETRNTDKWYTLKEIAESLMRVKLPDINPKDAIELGKTTPFSADEWYRGCTDAKRNAASD